MRALQPQDVVRAVWADGAARARIETIEAVDTIESIATTEADAASRGIGRGEPPA